MVGRVDIHAHDVADLELEPRVPGHLERLHLVRPGAVPLQDAVHGAHGHPRLVRQSPNRPVPGVPSPMIPGGDIARSIAAFTLSSSIGFFPGGRVASRRRPSTPSARNRPREDRAALARSFIAKAVWNMPTTRDLLDRVRADPTLAPSVRLVAPVGDAM